MNAIVPMNWHASLPEHLRVPADTADMASLGAAFESRAFARVSTNKNTFALISTDGEVMQVNQIDGGAIYLDLVFIKWAPHVTKTWYDGPYVEGSDAAPACFSMDGQTPDASSTNRQAPACASCPKNAFGSATNGSGKACQDGQRTAVILGADTPVVVNGAAAVLKAGSTVYGYRLAPMTGKNLNAKVKEATKMGVNLKGVVMRAKFVAQGVVDFAFLSYLGVQEYAQSKLLAESEEAIRACGLNDLPQQRPTLPPAPAHAQLAPPPSLPPAPTAAVGFTAPAAVPQPTPQSIAALTGGFGTVAPTAAQPAAEDPPRRRRGAPRKDAAAQAAVAPSTVMAPQPTFAPPAAAAFPSSPPAQNGGVIQTPTAASPELSALLDQVMNS